VSRPRLPIRVLLLALATFTAHAQTPSTPAPVPRKPRPKNPPSLYNPNVVVLDPGHGGSDTGAKLSETALEKDATVALAGKLKELLSNRGFTVILTHESASDQVAPDQRAEVANRSRAAACVLLHASNGGHGVHIFTSSLAAAPPTTAEDATTIVQPWDTAQAATIPESTHLATVFSDAFYAIRVPLVLGHASVQPIDAMTCPAIAIELSPQPAADGSEGSTPASDAAYQQRIAAAIASALSTWRGHIMAQIAGAAMVANPSSAPDKPASPPVRKPRPVPIPVETPVVSDPPPKSEVAPQ